MEGFPSSLGRLDVKAECLKADVDITAQHQHLCLALDGPKLSPVCPGERAQFPSDSSVLSEMSSSPALLSVGLWSLY